MRMDILDLAGASVIATGASSGIGAERIDIRAGSRPPAGCR
jgi:hypothetical protein